MYKQSKKTNAKKVLSIDNFVRECEFKEKTKYLTNTFLENFDAVRVEDLGLAYFIKEKFPSVKIQIILENFCHNINDIKEIKKVFGTSLQKIIISSELEFNTIKELINNKINIEVSLFSNILPLFNIIFSMRKLSSMITSWLVPTYSQSKLYTFRLMGFPHVSISFSQLVNKFRQDLFLIKTH